MAIRVIDDSKLQDIAVAIQGKDGGGQMTVDEMPTRIANIPSGGATLIPKTITQNGVYNASSDNVDGYDVVTVNVPQDPYEIMNKNIEGTLIRLRLNNVPSGRLKFITPGGASLGSADQTIQRIELPNNSDALGVWQFGNMRNLLLFDSGYTQNFSNVCLNGCIRLKWIVIRKNDGYATLYSTGTLSNAPVKIAVVPSLIEGYKNETNWSTYADKFRNLYFANSDIEKEVLIADSSIPNDSMIVCDYNETYYVKGEGIV